MQPVVLDGDGTPRFKENKLVHFLLKTGPNDLNKLAAMPWSDEDYDQLMQLIGYSTSGYGDLTGSSKKNVAWADAEAEKLLKKVKKKGRK